MVQKINKTEMKNPTQTLIDSVVQLVILVIMEMSCFIVIIVLM